MKILIASDIHGSAKYCRALLDRYEKEKAGRLLLLGDLLYHGPRNDLPEEYAPKQVIGMLNGLKDEILCVRGNCEAEVDQMVLSFPVMADYALMPLGERMIYITHGHVYNKENLPPMKAGDILLHGHTHVPACEEFGGYVYMNPGSVSIPKNGTPRGYMTLEGTDFTWKTLEGEVFNRYPAGK
ncbi:MAG: phosphodiesterase [Clostridiales bacterium]|nr:phosphodiesterase [Clostridia bacterium]MCR5566342.1 phosphodiesterase [Clostridiales bacterium]